MKSLSTPTVIGTVLAWYGLAATIQACSANGIRFVGTPLPSTYTVGASGVGGDVGEVEVDGDCTLVISGPSWIQGGQGTSYSNGVFVLGIGAAPNPSTAPRSGTLVIGPKSVTVTQLGNPNGTPPPPGCTMNCSPGDGPPAVPAIAGPLNITTPSLQRATWNSPYSATVLASGGTTPYTWSVLPYPTTGTDLTAFPNGFSFTSSSSSATIAINDQTRVTGTYQFPYKFFIQVQDSSAPQQVDKRLFTFQVSCGDSERDSTTEQYRVLLIVDTTGRLANPPVCQSFTNSASSALFEFPQLNVGDGTTWGLIRYPLVIPYSQVGPNIGLDSWVRTYVGPGGSRNINSGYRTPNHNLDVSTTFGGRHMWGDAVDLNNNTGTQSEWYAMREAAQRVGASYIEKQNESGWGHVHADWRNFPGDYQHGSHDGQ